MLKKGLFVLFLLIVAINIYAAKMTMTAKSSPTSISLSWSEVPGTVFYDIYMDDAFVVRLKQSESATSDYVVEKLPSNSNFTFKIAARDDKNNTLAAAMVKAGTSNWDGTYQWINKTDETNNGKLTELTLRVVTQVDPLYGQFYEIFYITPDTGKEHKIFPLFDFGDKRAFDWHKYKDNSIAGISYRTNAELFNTSPFKPGKWKVYSIVIDSNEATAYIQTSALGMEFLTSTVFKFYEDESGNKSLSLDTTGEQKIVDNYLFKNPNPGEGDPFILNKIS